MSRPDYSNIDEPSYRRTPPPPGIGGGAGINVNKYYDPSTGPSLMNGNVRRETTGIGGPPSGYPSTVPPKSNVNSGSAFLKMGGGGEAISNLARGFDNMGLGSNSVAFNVNDFPSLGGRTTSGGPGLNMGYADSVTSGLDMYGSKPSDSNPSPPFAITSEEFPALPGSKPSQGGMSNTLPSSIPTTGSVMSSSDTYGLLGLLNIIRFPDSDQSMLAIGVDLTTLGLPLNSPGDLYSSFSSPWSSSPSPAGSEQPKYVLPACYRQRPVPDSILIDKLTVETLFYIFYAMPRDELQLRCAQELYKRDWRYHKDYRLWFSRSSSGTTDGKSIYVYFDINSWTTIEGGRPNIEAGFMSSSELAL